MSNSGYGFVAGERVILLAWRLAWGPAAGLADDL